VVKDQVLKLIEKGEYHKDKKVLIGSTSEEGNYFSHKISPDANQVIQLPMIFGFAFVYATQWAGVSRNPIIIQDTLTEYAPMLEKQGSWKTLARVFADLSIDCGVQYALQYTTKEASPWFSYSFSYSSSNTVTPVKATHSTDIVFLFRQNGTNLNNAWHGLLTSITEFTPRDLQLISHFSDAWNGFSYFCRPDAHADDGVGVGADVSVIKNLWKKNSNGKTTVVIGEHPQQCEVAEGSTECSNANLHFVRERVPISKECAYWHKYLVEGFSWV